MIQRTPKSDWRERVMSCFEPRVKPPLGEWLEENVCLPPDASPWSRRRYPHLQAPGGPVDAFEDEGVRTIWLQFASRCGKTAFGHGSMLWQAANDPCSMLFASATEGLVQKRVKSDLYPMIEMCAPLRKQLLPKNKRSQSHVELRHCQIYCAWSGSTARLSDLSARVCHASEIDKWEGDAGREADPLKLFDERSKDHPTHKRIKESTPSVKRASRIEQGMSGSTSCRYHVPCPLCSTYQVLEFGEKDSAGGVRWPKETRDPGRVKKEAYYQCVKCGGRIENHHRAEMMQGGVWAPDGCHVNGSGQVEGTAYRTGEEWGYQLSSLYSLQLEWGDVAAEFLRCLPNIHNYRNFVNSWLGLTWEERASMTTEEELGRRLWEDRTMGVVPNDSIFLTFGGDVQGDNIPYVVTAWGMEARGKIVTYGRVADFDALWRAVLDVEYFDAAGTTAYRIPIGLIDSGFRTDETYRFCDARSRSNRIIWPCKGSSHFMTKPFDPRPTDRPSGVPLVMVNGPHWQEAVQTALCMQRPDQPYSFSIPREARGDDDLLRQLLNDAPVGDAKPGGHRTWDRRNTSIPNDFRDCLRYSRVAAEMHVAQQWNRVTPLMRNLSSRTIVAAAAPSTTPPARRLPTLTNRLTRPDGRPFVPQRNH